MRAPSLTALLLVELELRQVLLVDCAVDDDLAARFRRLGEPIPVDAPHPTVWPMFRARDELRLVERRISQILEVMR